MLYLGTCQAPGWCFGVQQGDRGRAGSGAPVALPPSLEESPKNTFLLYIHIIFFKKNNTCYASYTVILT